MKKVFIIIAILIIFEAGIGFLFPTYPVNECWKPLDVLKSYNGHSFSSFDNIIVGKVRGLIGDYHLNCDAGGFLLLAHDFPNDYFRGRLLFVNRPLYSFLIFLLAAPFHLISASYSMTFVSAILLNMIMAWLAAILLYSLLKRFFSHYVSLVSAILFSLSPLVRSWLVQPETNIFGAFAWVFSLWLFARYLDAPNKKRLYGYSLLVGILLLGKMNFAISIFIILATICFKRYREGAVFFFIHLIPIGIWYLLVTKLWNLPFSNQEVANFGVGVWFFALTAREFLAEMMASVPRFIEAVVYGFMLLPLPLAIYGLVIMKIKNKFFYFFGMALSLVVLFFALGFYLPRHAFLLFPVIYPLAVVGLKELADRIHNNLPKLSSDLVFYVIVGIMIVLANTNILQIYQYLNVPYV